MQILVLFLSTYLWAMDVPPLVPNVVDQANVLTTTELEDINLVIDEFHLENKVLPAVLIVDSLNNEPIEDYAEKVFRTWRLGQSGLDNGLLILVSVKDKKIKIEVGYNIEDIITDIQSGQIIREQMAPHFKNGHYASGIIAALREIKNETSQSSPVPASSHVPSSSSNPTERLYLWILTLFFIPGLILSTSKVIAKIKNTLPYQDLKKKKELNWKLGFFGAQSKNVLGVKLFILVNPGFFIVFFPYLFDDDPELTFTMNIIWTVLMAGLYLITFFDVRNLLSLKHYERNSAKKRLSKHKGKRLPGAEYKLFGKTFKVPTSSSSSTSSRSSGSSSSSSSSSRSSSSGGGRSGGGGASGGW